MSCCHVSASLFSPSTIITIELRKKMLSLVWGFPLPLWGVLVIASMPCHASLEFPKPQYSILLVVIYDLVNLYLSIYFSL